VPDNLDKCFDEAEAESVRMWARSLDMEPRLPSKSWTAQGRSGSRLVAIVVKTRGTGSVTKMIVKVLPRNHYATEPERHARAWECDPSFAKRYLVQMIGSWYPVGDGRFLMFQKIAGNLDDARTLGQLPSHLRATASACVVRLLLAEWNRVSATSPLPGTKTATVHEYLRDELRIPADEVTAWATAHGLGGETVECPGGLRVASPLRLLDPASSEGRYEIEYISGRVHGDANADNVLLSSPRDGQTEQSAIRLVDLSAFDHAASLSRDVAALTISLILPWVARRPADEEARELMDLIIDPREDDTGILPQWICDMLRATFAAAEELVPEAWHGEWRAQRLLSIVAQALTATTFDDAGESGRRWCFQLAARVAEAVTRDLSR
jgi:hypothetical protein